MPHERGSTLMNNYIRPRASLFFSLLICFVTLAFATAHVMAQCAPLISGLGVPLGVVQSERGNLFVSESGTLLPNTGRISIVDASGNRRTLLDGLPSAINDVGEIAGPAGLFLNDDTLYVVIGIGDTIKPGPVAGTAIPNPNPPASPIFSSILAIKFSRYVERNTTGFNLTSADQQALANGDRVHKSNGGGDRISLELIANFPDYLPEPSVAVPNNVRGSNPFDLVVAEDHRSDHRHDSDHDRDHDRDRDEKLLYVTDGGRNVVWKVNQNTGAFSILAVFPQVANPMFPALGPPFIDAVPTGIAKSRGGLFVTLFRGVPFPPGTSVVAQVNRLNGTPTPFITGLKTAIDVLPLRTHHDTDYLVLQHASAGPFFGSPGLILRFDTPAGPPDVIANCLTRPTSMAFDRENGTLYVTELTPVPPGNPVVSGRIVTVPFVP
jgi:hypothetical protein